MRKLNVLRRWLRSDQRSHIKIQSFFIVSQLFCSAICHDILFFTHLRLVNMLYKYEVSLVHGLWINDINDVETMKYAFLANIWYCFLAIKGLSTVEKDDREE